MATTTETTSSVVKNLIQLNTDRYNGYLTSTQDVDDSSLKDLFTRLSKQSNDFKNELTPYASSEDVTSSSDGTSVGSKVHRAWMDVKQAITGKDRHTILQSCEWGEDQILHAYKDALQTKSGDITSDALATIQRQESQLQESHDMIKALRDSKMN